MPFPLSAVEKNRPDTWCSQKRHEVVRRFRIDFNRRIEAPLSVTLAQHIPNRHAALAQDSLALLVRQFQARAKQPPHDSARTHFADARSTAASPAKPRSASCPTPARAHPPPRWAESCKPTVRFDLRFADTCANFQFCNLQLQTRASCIPDSALAHIDNTPVMSTASQLDRTPQ